MNDIILQLPLNHFGPVTDEVIKLLLSNQSVAVYGMPGCGRNYFGKLVQLNLDKQSLVSTFYFTSPIDTIKPEKEIVDTLISRLKLDPLKFQFSLQKYLLTHYVVIIFARLEDYFNYPKIATLLNRLRDIYVGRLTILSCFEEDIIVNYSRYTFLSRSIFLNLIRIPSFDLVGTKRILETNPKKNSQPYSPNTVNKIYTLSGGNPALIKYLGLAVQNYKLEVLNDISYLINDPAIGTKLANIYTLVVKLPKTQLIQLGILLPNNRLFSPLLTHYIKAYELENINEIVPFLSPQEKKLLTYFLINKGKQIDKDRLAFLIGLTDETFSLWAIYQAISRLKRKVKGKYVIKTLKGQGYILETS